jgi:uncharacterized protein
LNYATLLDNFIKSHYAEPGDLMNLVSRIFVTCERRSELVSKVYANVCAGLAVVAAVAFGVSHYLGFKTAIALSRFAILPSIGLPLLLRFNVNSMGELAAGAIFYSYNASLGLMLAPIMYAVASEQIIAATLMTGGLFWLALYISRNVNFGGTEVKYLNIGLLVLIAMSVLNLFLRLNILELLLSVAGMALFVGIIGYEISEFEQENVSAGLNLNNFAMLISLRVICSIVNLFIYALRFLSVTGRNRDQ